MNYNTSKAFPTGFSLTQYLLANLILILILITPMAKGYTQGVSGLSEGGFIIPDHHRPVLELKVLHQHSKDLVVFPGATIELTLKITNVGKETARGCQLSTETQSFSLVLYGLSDEAFDVKPGETLTFQIEVEFSENHVLGWTHISFMIDEVNGYDLFPERIVNFRVESAPEVEVVVSDYAIRDQRGVGYFEQFEDVRLFLRIHNCSHLDFQNVQARIEFSPDVNVKQLNPNFQLGSLQSGEFKDINAMVSTTVMSDNLSFTVFIDFDDRSIEQSISLEYRMDYKNPDNLNDEGCSEALILAAQSKEAKIQEEDIHNYPPLNKDPGKFAVVIPMNHYFLLDNPDYGQVEVDYFINLLTERMGYKLENIAALLNVMDVDLQSLDKHMQLTSFQQKWRRTKGQKELTFYYIGFGSVDKHNGEVYVLPSNFNPDLSIGRVNVSLIYEVLGKWKSQYNFNKVTAFFNMYYIEKSPSGTVSDNQYSYVAMQADLPGITSIISGSHNHEQSIPEEESVGHFNKMIGKAFSGYADYNNDGSIRAFELYRFIADELTGIPSRAWTERQSFMVPIFWGQDVVLY